MTPDLPGGYALRPATAPDAEAIAVQRGQMFVDMGALTDAQAWAQRGQWTDWLRSALPAGVYTGFLVEHGGQVVAGVGVMLHPQIPTLTDPATQRAHVLNMYVSPAHRRCGLAEALMHAALSHVRACGLRNVTLNAAPMGRPLYDRLGFTESGSPEMRLTLDGPA